MQHLACSITSLSVQLYCGTFHMLWMMWVLISREVVCLGAAGSSSAAKVKAEVKSEAEGDGPPRKKAKKGPILYQPCGRGEHCTCAICNKAKQQQVWAPA